MLFTKKRLCLWFRQHRRLCTQALASATCLLSFTLLLTVSAQADSPVVAITSLAQMQELQAQGVQDIIVKFSGGLSSSEDAALLADAGVSYQTSLSLPDTEVDVSKPGGLVAAVEVLNSEPGVVYAEPNAPVHATSAPTNSLFSTQWALLNNGQSVTNETGQGSTSGTSGDDINAETAWSQSEGANVVVGVVDTGIDYNATNPSLVGPDISDNKDDSGGLVGRVVPGYDFIAGDTNPEDYNGHGTFVSSIIASNQGHDYATNMGISGIAPLSQVMPLRVLDASGNGTWADVAEAFNYAGAAGVPIVNASLGSVYPDQTVEDAITAWPNTLFVFAAGNNATDNDTSPFYPCDFSAANVICVGASDQNNGLASFSDYGATGVDVFAPGVNIEGETLSNTTATVSGCTPSTPCPNYTLGNGTSFAAPMVSAVAALMLSADPTLTPVEIKADILATATPVPALSGLAASGGVLNAGAAVNLVVAQTTPPVIAFTDTPAASSTSTETDVAFTISGGDSTSISCTLDGDPTSCSANVTDVLTGLHVGSHVFTVTASGPGGINTASSSWMVTAPVAITPSGPTAPPVPPVLPTSPTTPTTPSPHPPTKPTPAPSNSTKPKPTSSRTATAFGWAQPHLSSNLVCRKPSACEATFSFVLSAAAIVAVTVQEKIHGKAIVFSHRFLEPAGAGRIAIGSKFGGHTLAAGSYQLTAKASEDAHTTSLFRAHLRVQ